MLEYLDCIVDVPLPDLEGMTLEEFNSLREKVNAARTVSDLNLEWTRTGGDSIFQGVPDENDLARSFGTTPYRARQVLNFEVMCLRLMRVRLEMVSLETSRKTEGYLAARQDLLSILEDRIRTQLNGIFKISAEYDQALERFSEHFMDQVTVLEGSTEGRLVRLYIAIRQMQSKMNKFELFGTRQFHDALEQRLLQKMEQQKKKDEEGQGFPEPPRDRRAEDSPVWKKFEREQVQAATAPAESDAEGESPGSQFEDLPQADRDSHAADGSISWEASFNALGPFFTVRILLRRGLFAEIKQWLLEEEGRYSPDLPRILMDCVKTEQNLRNRKKAIPQDLEEIISLMQKVIRES